MPSKTPKQAAAMAAAAHNPAIAKKLGIPMAVAKEFNEADRGSATLSEGMKEAAKKKKEAKAASSEALSPPSAAW